VRLDEFRGGAEGGNPARPDLETFTHPALADVADPRQSDLNTATIQFYWRLVPQPGGDVRPAAALNTGDPLLMENRAGRGRVLTFSTALDRSSGNLPLRSSFVPLILSLVYDMVAPDEQTFMNLISDTSLRQHLPSKQNAEPQAGLQAEVFSDKSFRNPAGLRVYPRLQAVPDNFVAGITPQKGFSVRWSGKLTPVVSGKHTFHLYSIEKAALRLDGETVIPLGTRFGSGSVELTADRAVDFECDWVYGGGHRNLRLEWEAPGLPRQSVPDDRFQAVRALEEAMDDLSGEIVSPRGERLLVNFSGSGDSLVIDGAFSTVPGLYRITLPTPAAARVENEWRTTYPVAVRPSANETPVEQLSAADHGLLSRQINLNLPRSREDLAAAMAGDIVGREFGAHLLLAAVIAGLLEVAMNRWISARRGIATARAPEFQDTSAGGSLKA
jgi:hypothetical protein